MTAWLDSSVSYYYRPYGTNSSQNKALPLLLLSITNFGRTVSISSSLFTTAGMYTYAFVYSFVSGTVNASGEVDTTISVQGFFTTI